MLKEAQSLDEYLATLYEGATLDSQGKFTIDLNRRMQKLAKHQLSKPENFVLGLVAAANLGGASQLRMATIPGGYTIDFDGQPISTDQCRRLHNVLSQQAVETADPRLQHLGMALNLVRNLHHGSVVLELTGSRQKLEITASGCHLKDCDPSLQHRLTLHGAGWNPFRIPRIRHSVSSLLQKRCSFGPARLLLDDQPQQPTFLEHPVVSLIINQGPPDH